MNDFEFEWRARVFLALPADGQKAALLKDAIWWWAKSLFPRSPRNRSFCKKMSAHCLAMREAIQ